MNKFGRNYLLTIQLLGSSDTENFQSITRNPVFATSEFIYISSPITLEFDIERKLSSDGNTGHFRIYNLSALNRNRIRHSAWNIGVYQYIQLRAGYTNNLSPQEIATLPVVFQGNITQASSAREGCNFITSIEALDGGYGLNYPQGNSNPIPPFNANSTHKYIIKTIMGAIPKVTVGAIGDYHGSNGLQNSFSEQPQDVLTWYTGKGFFIDNEVANALNSNEVIEDQNTLVINAQSGLLNTPQVEEYWLFFDMIFEPRLYIGQQIKLESSTDFFFNGYAKVANIHHRGTISGAVCGDAITTAGLSLSNSEFIPVPRVVSQ